MTRSAGRAERSLRRRPVRVWLVTGPPGRLLGFWLDFAAAIRQARRNGRDD